MKEYTGLTASTRCCRCGRAIAITRQFIIDDEYKYETENLDCRFIDKWGYARNFCNECMGLGGKYVSDR